MVHDLGGAGPPILLLHGLMGSAATWWRTAGWLGEHGHVYALDAAGHTGVGPGHPGVGDPAGWSTERFVDDVAAVLAGLGGGPVILWGHSMGGLHAWCVAAAHPELVRGVVVEEMAPDFRGRSAAGWLERARAWPAVFPDADSVRRTFGDVAGEYFLRAFTRVPGGWSLHGDPTVWVAIAEHWGTREHWSQWRAVRAPSLLVEAGDSITPPGQMAWMQRVAGGACTRVVVPGAGHLPHDEAPQPVRRAVTAFLGSL